MALADRPVEERAALAYCAPRGIPLSVFLGKVVYPGDPMWREEDRVAALDWLAEDLAKCSGCGQPLEDTTGQGTYDTWNADLTAHCDGCRALERKRLELSGSDDGVSELVGARLRLWQDSKET